MPYASAPDGARIYYETSGAGEPLLLVSGQGSDHQGWGAFRQRFVQRYQFIVFDHRGTGQSDKPEQPPYSTRVFAQDAIAVLDALGIHRAHAFGVSMGGRVCQWLAGDYPDRIGSMVLGCTTPGDAHGVHRQRKVEAAWLSANPFKKLPLLVSPGWLATHPHIAVGMAIVLNYSPSVPASTRRLHFQASAEHDAWDILPAITAPTLIIHGSRDRVNPTANALLLAERIPGAEVFIVEGGRHLFFLEFLDKTCHVVGDFLQRHPLPA
jgi:pimeloyl-ACP methyl ester carboxylesterase